MITDYILLAIIIILQILDAYTTWKNLQREDRAEGNALIKTLMDKIGILPALVVVKAVMVAVLAAAILTYPSIYLTVSMGVIIIGYTYIVYRNYKLLKG
jgi:uncharacterized membrane protein YiaA